MPTEKSVQLMHKTLQRLHTTSDRPVEDQWFTRREVALAFRTRNGRATDHLNNSRKDALIILVARGLVEEREADNEARGTKLYRLASAQS